jgi:glycerol-3-phosphate dehydrogenase
MDEPAPAVTGGAGTPEERRAAAREALGRTPFDLLVIGGGVIGAATAAHAARAGLAVALVDAGDFGSGTSSASSKLIHGGLRYLRLGDVRLVREAHHERRTLAGPVAPHLVHRLPFLLPLYRGGPFRPWFVQSGILLYSTLALSRLHWLVKPDRAGELVPALRRDDLRSCALYADAWTDDARLTLESVLAAAEAGATVLNRAEVVSLTRAGGRVAGAEVSVDGEVVAVRARVVVNAAGPWVDAVRRLEDPRAGTSVRLSKGAHVLVPGGEDWSAALTVPQDDVRVTFAVPWYGLLLLGTTDTDYEGDPADVSVDEADVAQILGEASKALPSALLSREAVRASFAGLRVLPLGEGTTANARRETVFSIGPGGMLSVAGGKLTTYRRIALDALERVRGPLGLRRLDRRPYPLPGARGGAPALPVEVDPEVEAHLRHLYGSRAAQVLEPARQDPALLERLHPDGPDIAAQALFAVTEEWAATVDDVLRRRTTVALRGLADADAVARVERLLGAGAVGSA